MKFTLEPSVEFIGATSNEVAIKILGRGSDGLLNIQLNLRAPLATNSIPPTERQLTSVLKFFPQVGNEITYDQAHALLCYRDYARAVMDKMFKGVLWENHDFWTLAIATLVSHDERVARDVRRWQEDRFRRRRGEARIVRTRHFMDLMLIIKDILYQMDHVA